MAKRKYKRLHYEDRQTIEAMSKQGSSVSDIAEALGTHRDTIYREFKRCNATLKTYTAAAGQQMQWQICERKKSRGDRGSRKRKPAAGISLSRKPMGLQCW